MFAAVSRPASTGTSGSSAPWSTTVGTPLVEGAAVTAKVLNQFRAPKEIAFKFKRRKGHHKTKGYRRALTKVEITSIAG